MRWRRLGEGCLELKHWLVRFSTPNARPMDIDQFPNNKLSRLQRQKRRDKRLAEELIECRRYAGGDTNKKLRQKGNLKKLQRMEFNGFCPPKEPINPKNTTMFEDNLEPLERFLRSHVGRPWAKVYAKLNGQLDRSTVPGQHVIHHLFGYLNMDGLAQTRQGQAKRYRAHNDGVSTRFAVHPESGLLCILNPRTELSLGPFPQKARYKKSKQSLKSRLRQGLLEKSRPQKKVPNAREWFQQFVARQVSGENGTALSTILHKNMSWCVGEWSVKLNLSRMEYTHYTTQIRGIKPHQIPAYKLKGRLWFNSRGGGKCRKITFHCHWNSSFGVMLDWVED